MEEIYNIMRATNASLKPLKKTDNASFRSWRRYVTFTAQENNWSDRHAIIKAYGSIQDKASGQVLSLQLHITLYK